MGALMLNISINKTKALKKFAMLLPLVVVVATINPLFNTLGETVLFYYWERPYTLEALLYGMIMGGMLMNMLLWFSSYNTIMTDDKFSYLFSTLSPSFSMLLSTVFRMIPSLTRKTRQILDARKCIGMGTGENASLREKLSAGMTAISALTSWALEGSVTTADSMNSRGYGTAKRSCFHSYRFTAKDVLITVTLVTTWVYTLVILCAGSAAAEFTPALHIAPVNPLGLGAYLVFILTPTILNWKEDIKWHILRSKI